MPEASTVAPTQDQRLAALFGRTADSIIEHGATPAQAAAMAAIGRVFAGSDAAAARAARVLARIAAERASGVTA
jgi:hypothetical protein